MKIYCVNSRCVAFSTAAGKCLSRADAEDMVKKLLSKNHMEPWSTIHIDMFSSGDAKLCLAYPGQAMKISIAPYALPFIADYFT